MSEQENVAPARVYKETKKNEVTAQVPAQNRIICIYNSSCTVLSKIIFFFWSTQESPSFKFVTHKSLEGAQGWTPDLDPFWRPQQWHQEVSKSQSCQELGGCARRGVAGAYLPQHMLLTTARLGSLAPCFILLPSYKKKKQQRKSRKGEQILQL